MLRPAAACLTLLLFASTALADAPATSDTVPPTDAAAEAAYHEASVEYERQMRTLREKMTPLFLKLRQSIDPRDWVLASQMYMLSQDNDDPAFSAAARAELLRNAAAAAPEDNLVQWIAMNAMPRSEGGCAAPQALPANLDTVLRLEADNGLAWLPVLRQAYQDKDALGIDSALSRMAAATRYDDHAVEYAQLQADLYRNNPDNTWLPENAGGWSKEDVWLQFALTQAGSISPSLHVLREICDREKQPEADPRRFAICADLGSQLLRHAKHTSVRGEGAALLAQVATSTPEVVAFEREQAWLLTAFSSGDIQQNVRRFHEALLRTGDEQEALREVARAQSLAIAPPPLWQAPEWDEESDLPTAAPDTDAGDPTDE